MAVAVAITSIVNADPSGGLDSTRTRQVVEGTMTLSGNYGTASSHGDPVDFSSAFIQSDYSPTFVVIKEDQGAGNAPLGLKFNYATGTTIANGVLQINNGTTEITEGTAYSGTSPVLNAVVLRFKAWFAKMV